MRENQADQIIDLLGNLVEELRGMRSEFVEFTGYNTTTMSDLSTAITGEAGYSIGDLMGPLGYNLQDLHAKLVEVISTLDLIEINSQ